MARVFFPFIFLLCFTFKTAANNNEGSETKKDTVSAVVQYGDNFLVNATKGATEQSINRLIDSLSCLDPLPEEALRQLHLYVSIKYMKHEEVVNLIDSLFDLDHIPYPLVNQINWYVANFPIGQKRELWFEKGDTSGYPANALYKSWNTYLPNPYLNTITEGDTSLYLVLQGTQRLQEFTMPYDGVLTSKYGWRDGRMHAGIDIDLQVWDSVYSAFPGMVRVSRWYEGYGRIVVVRHFNGLETYYAHLHRLKVKPGQIVDSGELIGLGGSSGHSTGSHLHFETRFKGIAINPLSFISFKEKKLSGDTLVLKKQKWTYASYPKGTQFHSVKWGDSLHKIAGQYGTSINKLCELNGIRRNKMLRVGQKIRII